MKSIKKIRYRCNNCGNECETEINQFIDAQNNIKARDDLISGELFAIRCPKCKSVKFLPYPLVYTDFDNEIVINFTLEKLSLAINKFTDNKLKLSKDTDYNVDEIFTGCQYRFVDDPFILGEKVQIFSQGLDDRIIEIYKAYIYEAICIKNNNNLIDEIIFNEIDDGYNFLIVNKDKIVGSIDFEKHVYNNIERKFYHNLEEKYDNYYDIDLNWALNIIDKL